MLSPGQILPLTIEKPAAGGRMIARVDGQIVLVSGAIPGERVSARIERVAKGVAYAETSGIDEASADRRASAGDPSCGGCAYSYISYQRQLELKSLVIADAFARIARAPLKAVVSVAASPEEGYRMRARLHVRGGRWGFFREGTHELCDARQTRQLLPATCDTLDRLVAALASPPERVIEIELSENVDASERVVHVDRPQAAGSAPIEAVEGLAAGPYVTDEVTLGDGVSITLRRHVLAFFQGNRYLLQPLAAHVVSRIEPGSLALDLYAGAGLFAVAASEERGAKVTAVEGDRFAAADLAANAAGTNVVAAHESVESFASRSRDRFDVAILDPPRTGVSREALAGVIRLAAARVIYVSCDIATLARDARRLLDAGYRIREVEAFDLFPNTPHVETVAIFER